MTLVMTDGPKLTLRPDSEAQMARHRKAAKVRRWSLNRFYIEAAEKLAAETLATQQSSEQLMVKSDPLPLNQ